MGKKDDEDEPKKGSGRSSGKSSGKSPKQSGSSPKSSGKSPKQSGKVSKRAPEPEPEDDGDFEDEVEVDDPAADLLDAAVKNTPWWAISLAVHGLILACLPLIIFS